MSYTPHHDFYIKYIFSAFEAEVSDDFYFPGELHEVWEMVYCIDGVIMSSEDDQIYELRRGQMVLHAPFEFHRLWVKKGQRAKYMIISFHSVGNDIASLCSGVFNLNTTLRHQLTEAFNDIIVTFDCNEIPVKKGSGGPIDEHRAIMKYELFLLTTASETTPASVQLSSVSAGKYRKILGVLKNNVDGNLNAEEIARLCLLGVSNMKKIFRQYAGCGVMDYYKKLRIIRACELLKSGVGVADISEIMNFSSPNYFTMTFKREMGVPPSKYLK